jgi:penicillin-binding protein 2
LVLADNQPVYCLALYTEELRQRGPWSRTIDHIDALIDELSQVLALDREVERVDIQRHVQRRLPLPFIAWRGLDTAAMARWAESGRVFAGVDIYVESERVYPQGMVASHLLGYVGRADTAREAENPFHYYLPEMAGREGVERSADRRLRGRAGGLLIRVDASGFKYHEYGERESVAGEHIRLTLDFAIQAMAENVLNNEPGAVVVLDPRNGDILALASGPSMDRNALASRAAWQELMQDPQRPALNRAISGQYPPGSVFKPLVALTGLLNERIGGETVFPCPGYYEMGGIRFRCWLRRGHGPLSLRAAIAQSCNPYFIETALRTGHQRIYHMADSVGFGRLSGIDLPGEAAGPSAG